jgi:hypothetical protein
MLGQAVEPEETLRYETLRPLREYVMNNYQIVERFGQQILFRRK